ncbi:chromate transporter [Dyadobacter luteus]|jgi:chromate transporter|uniref:Chromate transporter n=1 Tax=Dyadobacter luteus TaxID=2259619 RepID=A0A3D8YG61_9BACT|nr:chromate transporter [Dyadobacter luteus]REA63641.1 chromate transporter [Dyadobacter luteus]
MNIEPTYSLSDLARYFLRLGTLGFGGPAALVSAMYQDLAVERKWITEADYQEGIALSQLAPGPLAAQLAIYLGYVHYGYLGATVVGITFVIPSFLMVLILGVTYVKFGGLPWIQALFYGIEASVIGIIANGTYKLTLKTVKSGTLGWFLFVTSAAATAIMETEVLALILGSGGIYWYFKSRPASIKSGAVRNLAMFLPQIQSINSDSVLWKIAIFFTKAGAFVFGSGLAIVPFLYAGAVKENQWLTEQQFLDAVAIAMITPGPVVITVAFIGYLVAGFSGACVAAISTFLPCYLFTVLPAPYFKRWGKNTGVKDFVQGITITAIGAIAGAVIVLARRQLIDIPSVAIAALTLFLLHRYKKLSELYIIAGAAIIGSILSQVLL